MGPREKKPRTDWGGGFRGLDALRSNSANVKPPPKIHTRAYTPIEQSPLPPPTPLGGHRTPPPPPPMSLLQLFRPQRLARLSQLPCQFPNSAQLSRNSPFLAFARNATSLSQGRANGAKNGPGKRLGAKKGSGMPTHHHAKSIGLPPFSFHFPIPIWNKLVQKQHFSIMIQCFQLQ